MIHRNSSIFWIGKKKLCYPDSLTLINLNPNARNQIHFKTYSNTYVCIRYKHVYSALCKSLFSICTNLRQQRLWISCKFNLVRFAKQTSLREHTRIFDVCIVVECLLVLWQSAIYLVLAHWTLIEIACEYINGLNRLEYVLFCMYRIVWSEM